MKQFLMPKWLPKNSCLWEARTQIFAWYVGLTSLLVILSIPIFSQLAIREVDNRVQEDLLEELEAFEIFVSTYEGNNPKAFFDSFLSFKIPADKTFLIAMVNQEFYRSSPVGLPQAIAQNSPLIKSLATITQPIKDKHIVKDLVVGDILYLAEPLELEGKIGGVLIVAHIPQGEREEVLSAILIAIRVLFMALIISLIVAWKIAGTVLKPVRTLILAASSISETDLSQRIPVRGEGEMGELAKTFNSMMSRLETAFATQRQFINDASHQLRTPITIIRGHLEILEYCDPQEQQETIQLVIDELTNMGRLIEDLLLLAKTELQNFLILEQVNLTELTREIFLKVQTLGERQWQLDHQGKGTIVVDRQRIIQAIMNLAHNAIQNTTPTDTITFGSAIEAQEIRFWIRDTGTGIPPQKQELIFQKFTRTNTDSAGFGLGLSIVSAIAKSHQGRIELHSILGKGSTFTIVLPNRLLDHQQSNNQ